MPMGLFRLLVPPGSRVTEQLAERAYLSGPDNIPWTCRARLTNGELVIERSVADSGKFHIPWPVEGYGEVMLCTGTLMERSRPYHLEVELARGKINQVRNQIADWQAIGLAAPPPMEEALHKALGHLSRAVTIQHEPSQAAEHAERAIAVALAAADLLVDSYIDQVLAVRHRQSPKLPTLLGANLGQQVLEGRRAAQFLKAFNSATVPLVWREIEATEANYNWEVSDRQVEWCLAHGLKVFGGPLLRLDDRALPDWLCLWEGDFASLLSFVSDYVETAVSRYRGKVHLWQCAARMNVAGALSLGEEERLRLAVRALEITRGVDPGTPVTVRFDQPWAEYMSRTEPDLSPLHFADALVRVGLQLASIGLEINVGYHPGGSSPRDRLEYSRLLDLWSYLGLPLHLMLTVPSGDQADPQARGRPMPLRDAYPGGWSRESQASWVAQYIPLMLAKPAVQAITWNQLCDAQEHDFPHGGLIDAAGKVKPALGVLAALRKEHLE